MTVRDGRITASPSRSRADALECSGHLRSGSAQRRVRVSAIGRRSRRLGVLDLAEPSLHIRMQPAFTVRELVFGDADPERQLTHDLERGDPLAALDARDIRSAAPRKRKLTLAQTRRFPRLVKAPADLDRVVVMRDPIPPTDHGHMTALVPLPDKSGGYPECGPLKMTSRARCS